MYCTRARFSGVEAQTTRVLVLVYYTAHNVIHLYIVHMLPASISQNFLSDSTSTLGAWAITR